MKIFNKITALVVLAVFCQSAQVKPVDITPEMKITAGLASVILAKYGLETAQIQQLDKKTEKSLKISAGAAAVSNGMNLAAIVGILTYLAKNKENMKNNLDVKLSPPFDRIKPEMVPAILGVLGTSITIPALININNSTIKTLKDKDAIIEFRENRTTQEDTSIAKQIRNQQVWLTFNYLLAAAGIGIGVKNYYLAAGMLANVRYKVGNIDIDDTIWAGTIVDYTKVPRWSLTLQVIALAAAYISEQIRSHKLAKLELMTKEDVVLDEPAASPASDAVPARQDSPKSA